MHYPVLRLRRKQYIKSIPNASVHESFVKSEKAGILACTVFAVLPAKAVDRIGESPQAKTHKVLTVAGQPVTHTRFPFNFTLVKTPSVYDENKNNANVDKLSIY